MSGAYNSSHELAAKMDSEGGLGEFIFGYGLNTDDLPDDMPADIKAKFLSLLDMKETYEEISEFLWAAYDADPVPGDYDYQEPAYTPEEQAVLDAIDCERDGLDL